MLDDTAYDAIVIGSGIGGMSAAGLLSGVAGRKVLVLEKHTEPGGQTHAFRRDGASWDVGLHYIGAVGPGSQTRAFFDYLSGGELQWTRMPENFEHFVYPGLHFEVPSNPREYEDRLIAAFPDEEEAIRQYFLDIRKASKWFRLRMMRGMVPRVVAPLLQLASEFTAGDARRTTAAYLDKHFRSPKLRALLASQWGDYGLPPSQSCFAIHALIVEHYRRGAWFPKGGAARIARTFEKGIERTGGAIRVAQEVVEIVLEDGKAAGVRVIDRRGPTPEEKIYRAPVVISNVGAINTFNRLLPTTGKVGAVTAALRREVAEIGSGISVVVLYVRLKADARTLGVQGENYWVFGDMDHDDIQGQTADLLQGRPRSLYMSFPSIKAGDDRFHTVEMITTVAPEVFAAWASRPKGNRGADYSQLKERITKGLLELAQTALPGLGDLVIYSELATPPTFEHYTTHPRGAFYGLAANPRWARSRLLGPVTPIPGLFLSGQDAACCGVVGAMMGGVGAASQVLGSKGFPMIQAALKKPPTNSPAQARLPQGKLAAVIASKQRLTAEIWDVRLQVDGALPGYVPGQFARLHTGEGEWRDYSIAGVDGAADPSGQQVRLLISTRTGGHGSRFIEAAPVGTRTEIELPLGEYTLADSPRKKVFVATGTGLAPFLPMFGQLQRQGRIDDATLVFGCRTVADDITAPMTGLPPTLLRCISREDANAPALRGRVTDGLAGLAFDPEATDFYLCGSAAMVSDCKTLLERRGAKYLYIENY